MRPLIGPVSCLACILLVGAPVHADAPALVLLQGRITQGDVPPDGPVSLDVGLYATSTSSVALYAEAHGSIPLVDGRFTVTLGDGPASPEGAELASVVESHQALWVGMTVDGGDELPRRQLHSVAYAMQARTADVADQLAVTCSDGHYLRHGPGGWECAAPGVDCSDGPCVSSSEVDFAWAAGTSKGGPAADLQCSACVGAADLAVGVVTSAHLSDGGVAAADVAFDYAAGVGKGGAAADLQCSGCVDSSDLATGLTLAGTVTVGELRLADLGGNGIFWTLTETSANDLVFGYGGERLRVTQAGVLDTQGGLAVQGTLVVDSSGTWKPHATFEGGVTVSGGTVADGSISAAGDVSAGGQVILTGSAADPASVPLLDVAGGIRVGTVAPCTPATEGTLRYNATDKTLELCIGTGWQSLTVGDGGGSSVLPSIACRFDGSGFNPGTGSKTHSFTAAECGGTVPTSDHVGLLSHATHCGADEDWRALGADDGSAPGVSNWMGSSCNGGTWGAVYVDKANRPADEVVVCSFVDGSFTPSNGSHTHAWSTAECGGILPDASYTGVIAHALQCGRDEDWRVLDADEAGGPAMQLWISSTCAQADYKAVYLKNGVGLMEDAIVCQATVPQGSGSSHTHAWTASQCGGTLPDASYSGTLSWATQCGPDEDWRVLDADDSGGPGFAWWNASPCGSANLKAVYLRTGAEVVPPAGPPRYCFFSGANYDPGTGGKTHTYSASECGGTLPTPDYVGLLSQASHCGADEDWRALSLDDGDNPGISNWMGSSCQGGNWAALFVDIVNRPQGEVIVCSFVDPSFAPPNGTHTHTWTEAECGGQLPDSNYVGVMAHARQCGRDEDWRVLDAQAGGPAMQLWIANTCGDADYKAVYFKNGVGAMKDAIICEGTHPQQNQNSHTHMWTAAECGGVLPDASYRGTLVWAQQCGGDEDWRVLDATNGGPGMTWWNAPPCGSASIRAVYFKM